MGKEQIAQKIALLKETDKVTLDNRFNANVTDMCTIFRIYGIFLNIELDEISNEYSVNELCRLKFKINEDVFYTKFNSYLEIIMCLEYFNAFIVTQEEFNNAMTIAKKYTSNFEEEVVDVVSDFIRETFEYIMDQIGILEITT